LRKFPLDILKIDRSFVQQVEVPGESAALLIAMIGIAQSLKTYHPSVSA
jgi:EAL domain-containing protein (putative c-di-GMP-specific phosphodiesterase class I)